MFKSSFPSISPQGDGNSQQLYIAMTYPSFPKHFPARGRKLNNHSYLNPTTIFPNYFPVRGRKLPSTWIIIILTPSNFPNHFPARGRKSLIVNNYAAPYTTFPTISPQGDGNNTQLGANFRLFIAVSFPNHFPTRGRKHKCKICMPNPLLDFPNHFPVRGRKQHERDEGRRQKEEWESD